MLNEQFYFQKTDRRMMAFLVIIVLAAVALVVILGRSGQSNDVASDARGDSLSTLTAARRWHNGGRAPRNNSYQQGAIRYDEGSGRPAARLTNFDPNTADSTQLLALGLSPWIVRSIYRYRNKGGVFRRKEDFAQVYGLTAGQYRTLQPYISISPRFLPARDVIAPPAESAPRDTVRYPIKLAAGQHVALNTADTTALRKVPGIGAYYARRIVAYRDQLGGYVDVAQLGEIDDFPTDALPFFSIDKQAVKKLKINSLTLWQLRKHPYIGYRRARDIMDYRRLRGPITSIDQLRSLASFTADDIARLRPYLEF